MFDQSSIKITRYHINTAKTSASLKVALLADLHNKEFGTDNIDLVEKIKSEKPDIIALQEVNGKNPLDDLMAAEMENTCNMHAKLLPGMGRMQPAVDVAACQNKRLDLLTDAADLEDFLKGLPVD